MDCVICLQKIRDKSITACNHEFCRECILQWVIRKHNCPMCRRFLTTKSITGRLTRQGSATMRVYGALERYIDGPRSLDGMLNVFEVVLKKENRILLNNNKDFRKAYNEKVKQAEEIYDIELNNYYYYKKK